jgi:hypothetical protein
VVFICFIISSFTTCFARLDNPNSEENKILSTSIVTKDEVEKSEFIYPSTDSRRIYKTIILTKANDKI